MQIEMARMGTDSSHQRRLAEASQSLTEKKGKDIKSQSLLGDGMDSGVLPGAHEGSCTHTKHQLRRGSRQNPTGQPWEVFLQVKRSHIGSLAAKGTIRVGRTTICFLEGTTCTMRLKDHTFSQAANYCLLIG